MKVIDAYWEKRNLGESTVEITIELEDQISEIEKVLQNQREKYQVVRVPEGYVECNQLLTKHNFYFIEAICSIKNDLKHLDCGPLNDRIKSQMRCKLADAEQLDFLFDELNKGIFTTDRIALDPYFSVKQAGIRYIGWIKDVMEKGGYALNIYYKNEPAGFLIYRIDGENADVLLGGMYEKFVMKGIGVATYSKGYEYIKQSGVKKTFSAVSTNNRNAIKTNLAIGYEICGLKYVFVKHI